jgi:Transposase DDE domain/Transposase domain (DUF772)
MGLLLILILRASCKTLFCKTIFIKIEYLRCGVNQIFMPTALRIWNHIQRRLFPVLEEEMGPLGDKDRQFVHIIGLLPLGRFLEAYLWTGLGCPLKARAPIVHAFIAKAVYGFATTRALLESLAARPTLRRLCGWESAGDIPSEATFSRAFADFSARQLLQQIHLAMVQTHLGSKLIGHLSRDAMAIEAREKAAPKAPPPPLAPKKRGRPAKGEVRPPQPPTRLEQQLHRSLEENLADLPTACAVGCKRNSQGHQETWMGYKLHLDTVDGDIPISALLTGAGVHDSQAAIPLAQLSAWRVTSLYDLMDSAYDAPPIHEFSRRLGHVPIIEPNPRRGPWVPLDPAQQVRFGQRSAAERVNSQLLDNYGGRFIRVRGAAKVMTHLMFGVIALTAMQLYRLVL